MGESGSGKSTLLNLIATLDKQTSGDVILSGENTKKKVTRKGRNLGGKNWALSTKIFRFYLL